MSRCRPNRHLAGWRIGTRFFSRQPSLFFPVVVSVSCFEYSFPAVFPFKCYPPRVLNRLSGSGVFVNLPKRFLLDLKKCFPVSLRCSPYFLRETTYTAPPSLLISDASGGFASFAPNPFSLFTKLSVSPPLNCTQTQRFVLSVDSFSPLGLLGRFQPSIVSSFLGVPN